jgi:hypothetical protein
MKSVENIYQELKSYYESIGTDVDDNRLRQMAWVRRDRMMFENTIYRNQSSNTSPPGGKRRTLTNTLNQIFTIMSGETFTINGDFTTNAQLIIEEGGVLNIIGGSIIENVAIVNNGIINLL